VRIAAIVGESGSGKTTLVVSLIRHFVDRGESVAAIKHTHHPLNLARRGDTAAFEAAGAEPVILAGNREAVIFTRDEARTIVFDAPDDLLAYIDADVVFVEGFKDFDAWPRISPLKLEDALDNLSRIWRIKT
jgi:molybdopterin-guanine dinucleotide biosynthesis protein B